VAKKPETEEQITGDILREIADTVEFALGMHLRKRPLVHPPEGIVRLDRDTLEVAISRPAVGWGIQQIFEVTVRLKRRVGDGFYSTKENSTLQSESTK
jgi:hypothetical protein